MDQRPINIKVTLLDTRFHFFPTPFSKHKSKEEIYQNLQTNLQEALSDRPHEYCHSDNPVWNNVRGASFKYSKKRWKTFSGRYAYAGKLNGKPYYTRSGDEDKRMFDPASELHLVNCGDNFWAITDIITDLQTNYMTDSRGRVRTLAPDRYDSNTIWSKDLHVKSRGTSNLLSKLECHNSRTPFKKNDGHWT